VIIGDSLVERKGLRQVEIKGLKEGFKVIHQVKSIIWVNQTKLFQLGIKDGSLERGHFSLV
jgi:hypothetical protein